jgi:hypothetical protein
MREKAVQNAGWTSRSFEFGFAFFELLRCPGIGGLSKTSGMLDGLQHFSAQAVSKMSKKTKMYFIKALLNQPSETGCKNLLHKI